MSLEGMVKGMMIGVIGLVIVVTILGATVGTVATAGNTVNANYKAIAL